MTLSDFLRELAEHFGPRAAILGERSRLSFAELDAAADRWADAFTAAGYGSGSHIGLLAGNGPQWLSVAFAVWRCGATLVPISTFVTARELSDITAHADLSLLLAQPQLRSHSYEESLQQVAALPAPPCIVRLGESEMPTLPSPPQAAGSRKPSPESIACILYTSGTTGRPKGVMLSHRAILATTRPTGKRTGLEAGDILLSTLPLFWVAGLVIRALPTLATGCTLLLPETFTADVVVNLLREHATTALHLRPPQVGQILAHPAFEPSLLAKVTKGGGRIAWYAPYLSQARLITGYGMTEMAGYVTALDSNDPAEVLHAQIGAPLPGVDIRIVDKKGRAVAADVTGEIHVRGPGLFSGYYKEPDRLGLSDDGWFVTGDLGSLAADGTFYFSGRSKDLLRVKGINVSPVEVEIVLAAHPAVEAAYVVGLPPDGLDQQVVALIVSKHTVGEKELRAHVAAQLSHYKRPERYAFIERAAVPLGGTSKPQRPQLAALAASLWPP